MGCNEYKLSRRAMMGATGASVLGLSIRDLLALPVRITRPRPST